jgi:DNA-binding HxlR family transcriptional regulator
MKRTAFEKDVCPVARSLEAVGDTWSMLIVRQAFAGDRRFGEFERSLGVAKSFLTVRSRKLVALGVLEQVPVVDSMHREYTPTEQGRGLYLVLMALRRWGEGCGRPAGYTLANRRDRKPVKPRAFHAHDGRELGAGDMTLVPASEV